MMYLLYIAQNIRHISLQQLLAGTSMLLFTGIIKRRCLLLKIYNITMQWPNRQIVFCSLQVSDQERFNGKFQENQVVGLMVLDERMSGMPVKRIAGCKIILQRLEKQIDEYDGENWIEKYPE